MPWGTPEEYLEQGLACGELSGGQKQMVYILAVLASRPKLLICDEVLCGLDVDRQASALQMLQKLQVETGMAILYLSVDLQAVQLMAHAAAFMEKGRLVEHQDDAHALLEAPASSRRASTSTWRARSRSARAAATSPPRSRRASVLQSGYKTSIRKSRALESLDRHGASHRLELALSSSASSFFTSAFSSFGAPRRPPSPP